MTHLKIELNNGIIEEVSSAVIDKLYDIVHNGTLDNTSNLVGRLHTDITYADYVDYLEDYFKVNGVKLLIINADGRYIRFIDPVVESYWINTAYGDGVGITTASAALISLLSTSVFKNNTNVTSFNELSEFISLSTLPLEMFRGCTSLQSVNLLNVSTLGSMCFYGCTSLLLVGDTSHITSIPYGTFYNCSNLKCIDLSNVTSIGETGFNQCSSLIDLSTSDPLLATTSSDTYTFVQSGRFLGFDGTKLTNKTFNLPNVTSIGIYCFRNTEISGISAPNVTLIENNAFTNCSNLTSVLMANITTIDYYAFRGCTSLPSIDISNVSSIGSSSFNGCTSLGTGQTLELTLTLTNYPTDIFTDTKYKKLILHCQSFTGSIDGRYGLTGSMPDLEYLDLSDVTLPPCATLHNGKVYFFLLHSNINTVIMPSNVLALGYGSFNDFRQLRYMIILNTTPPELEYNTNHGYGSWLSGNPNLNIYVPDSVKNDYLSASDWSLIAGGGKTITNVLHGLSELPAGVWTTGKASQYLTAAQLVTS